MNNVSGLFTLMLAHTESTATAFYNTNQEDRAQEERMWFKQQNKVKDLNTENKDTGWFPNWLLWLVLDAEKDN